MYSFFRIDRIWQWKQRIYWTTRPNLLKVLIMDRLDDKEKLKHLDKVVLFMRKV
jgi:hypothetical protein